MGVHNCIAENGEVTIPLSLPTVRKNTERIRSGWRGLLPVLELAPLSIKKLHRRNRKNAHRHKRPKHCRKPMEWLGFNFYRCNACGQDFVIRHSPRE